MILRWLQILPLITVLAGAHCAVAEESVSTGAMLPVIEAQLNGLVPQVVRLWLKEPTDLEVQYLTADLDGSGADDYVIATFVARGAGGKILVLRNVDGVLEPEATSGPAEQLDIEDDSILRLVHVDNCDAPAIEIDKVSDDGSNVALHLFKWSDGKLTAMPPTGTDTANAYLADPQGTGVPEIVIPPC
jgi:hypothetical protein